MATASFDFGFSSPVMLTNEISESELFNFRPFQDWANALKKSLTSQVNVNHPFHQAPYSLRSIRIQSVDRFGKRIGFVKLVADIRNKLNAVLPGVVLLRGGSVAVLMILRPSDSETERWVVMTEQPRIPAGSLDFIEIPAGMLDDNGNIVAAAAKEILEETEFEIPLAELKDLTAIALNKAGSSDHLQSATYLSPGGSDEYISIFLWEKELERQKIDDLKGKHTGLRAEGERIVLRLFEYNDLWKVVARDGKSLLALALYERSLKEAS